LDIPAWLAPSTHLVAPPLLPPLAPSQSVQSARKHFKGHHLDILIYWLRCHRCLPTWSAAFTLALTLACWLVGLLARWLVAFLTLRLVAASVADAWQ